MFMSGMQSLTIVKSYFQLHGSSAPANFLSDSSVNSEDIKSAIDDYFLPFLSKVGRNVKYVYMHIYEELNSKRR